MTLEQLIGYCRNLAESDLPLDATVYVPEKSNLNGAGWCSPSEVRLGYDPHPVSAANDGTLVVYIS